ncbi:histidinol dehydrogenase [Parashewanella curva]|uniref:Histidinol dehydrogenase n=1 Tax=Parashewanella curva TaxID=2338552 RepID=A0A3L8PSS1_9GAMM|nr:histidinol dehydrogenase [Parashewanella curva]RLV58406.1 histidinol dehydrogenase [Parashewanella curva]
MQILEWSQLDNAEQLRALSRAELIQSSEVSSQVDDIIQQVISGGDNALKALTSKLDNIEIPQLAVNPLEILSAVEQLDDELNNAIKLAFGNIQGFHAAQAQQTIKVETTKGVECELRTEAIESVGLYIPGGTAPLLTTTLMLAIPAMLAGCQRKVIVSPPPIHPSILAIAEKCGIDEIYQLGGAQAIAALAYGTETIKPVDKIFGPGNRYVTEAKSKIASDNRTHTTIDMPAGPSEVLVIADDQASAEFVAADLLSQAEHGVDSQCICITTCQKKARDIYREVDKQLSKLPRQEIAAQALMQSRIIVVNELEQAVEISNRYAPEHLIVQSQSPRELLSSLRNAGSIFLGAYSPESMGDYASGTNHVLPTYGYAKSVSSLSLADFQRRYTVQSLNQQGFLAIADAVITLANAEQLEAHANAARVRKQAILKEQG